MKNSLYRSVMGYTLATPQQIRTQGAEPPPSETTKMTVPKSILKDGRLRESVRFLRFVHKQAIATVHVVRTASTEDKVALNVTL
jgi:hypothetical protein